MLPSWHCASLPWLSSVRAWDEELLEPHSTSSRIVFVPAKLPHAHGLVPAPSDMRLGPYEILGTLGHGGAGTVFRARAPSGEKVAVKVLHGLDEQRLARFERERRLLGSFTARDGFVPLLDAGKAANGPFLVMPIVPGGTLRERLRKGPWTIEETLSLGRSLAAALARAHERGIVHRDLKPENVLFTAEGRPLVADLGLGKHFDRTAASRSASLSTSGVARGTFGYMPPEQTRDSKSVGPEADVFALGAILYECLAGKPAFAGESGLEILASVASGPGEPLGRARPDVPRWLARVVARALAPDASDRFEDGAALLAALSAPPRRRRNALAWLALTLVALAAAGLVARRILTERTPGVATNREGVETRGRARTDDELTRKARAGDAQAMVALGLRFERGEGVAKDEVEAVRWFKNAAESGHGSGMFNFGLALSEGRGVEKDEVEAVRWFRRSAEAGDALGKGSLGTMLLEGRGTAKDEVEAARWLREAAAAGDALAMNNLGALLQDGRGVAKDAALAASWYRRSALAGNFQGMSNLGIMLLRGEGVASDGAEAARWFLKAAEGGDAAGMFNFGFMLAEGQGIARDEAEAVRWFKKAADAGSVQAMTSLGNMLVQGRGVAKDEAEAIRWYRKAAEAGHVVAMSNLAGVLLQGAGTAEDKAEAARWFRKAADAGHARSMYNLGVMLERGDGVPRDQAEADRWFRKAASLGDDLALETVRRARER